MPKPFQNPPATIGEHLKRRRLECGLRQLDVANLIGVSEGAIQHWESDKTEPPIMLMPAVTAWLGYAPYPEPVGYPARLLAKRRHEGWTMAQAATLVAMSECSWSAWERGITAPRGKVKRRVEALLAGQP
jgi:transcriptional regulator with XRE-family HTH domain